MVELLPYLVFGVELRTIPKKITLSHLAQYTGQDQQRRRLSELSSKQGNNEYQKLILEQNITICDILRLFDTCKPPLNVLLAHLINAKPRYFSASSLPKIIPVKPCSTNHTATDFNTNPTTPTLATTNNLNHSIDPIVLTNETLSNQLKTLSLNNEQTYQCKFRIILSVSNHFSHTFMRTSENLLGLFSGKFFQVLFINLFFN